jgi:hypothetical protein
MDRIHSAGVHRGSERRTKRRFNHVERIEDEVAVAHEVLSGDGTWSGFTDQSLCQNEHAPFRNQIADSASNTLRARGSREECFVGTMIVDRRTADFMRNLSSRRMIVVPMGQQDGANVGGRRAQRLEPCLNVRSIRAHAGIDDDQAVSHLNDVGAGLI